MQQSYVLILHSGHVGGKIEAMSRMIAEGVNRLQGMEARCRTVKMLDVDPKMAATAGDVLVTLDDLEHASGVIVGSPTRFGNMSASLKNFLDQTGGLWMRHALVDKPCGFFTSSTSIHGGQEATLLSMMVPMLHHGMLMVGVPYSEPALSRSTTGGTPYGASHVDGGDPGRLHSIDADEYAICVALGYRVARMAHKLAL